MKKNQHHRNLGQSIGVVNVLSYLSLLPTAVSIGCGGQTPAAGTTPSSAQASPSRPEAASEKNGGSLGKTALTMTYEVIFADSTGSVEIWIDGNFLKIEEAWERSDAVPSLRWGTTKARMLFDRQNQRLLVINLENSSFTRITTERIAKENELSADKMPMVIGGIGGSKSPTAMEDIPVPMPTPVETPQKQHPAGCSAYARALPLGLQEETCFESWEQMGLPASDLGPLMAFFELVRELKHPPSEIKVVAAIADALSWDVGLLVSRHEFGISPFEEETTIGLQPWDVIVKLKRAERVAPPQEEVFVVPEKAEEKFTLVPWKVQSF